MDIVKRKLLLVTIGKDAVLLICKLVLAFKIDF